MAWQFSTGPVRLLWSGMSQLSLLMPSSEKTRPSRGSDPRGSGGAGRYSRSVVVELRCSAPLVAPVKPAHARKPHHARSRNTSDGGGEGATVRLPSRRALVAERAECIPKQTLDLPETFCREVLGPGRGDPRADNAPRDPWMTNWMRGARARLHSVSGDLALPGMRLLAGSGRTLAHQLPGVRLLFATAI